jgi:hypothetical protein
MFSSLYIVWHSSAVGLGAEVMAHAADDSRTLVTHDCRTMPTHFADFIVWKEGLA